MGVVDGTDLLERGLALNTPAFTWIGRYGAGKWPMKAGPLRERPQGPETCGYRERHDDNKQ